MNKPEGVTYLLPKYFTEIHKEVLEILGEQKCLEISKILDPHDSFSFQPIAIYLKRVKVKSLLAEGNLSTCEIAKEVGLHPETVRRIQITLSKKTKSKLFQ